MSAEEAAVYDMTTELSTTHELSDATFKRAKALFTDQQIVDIVAVSGTYVTIAMLLATAEEGVPPGKEPPFRQGEN